MGGRSLKKGSSRRRRPRRGGADKINPPRKDEKLAKINVEVSKTTLKEDEEFISKMKEKLAETLLDEETIVVEKLDDLTLKSEPISNPLPASEESEEEEPVKEKDYFVVVDFEATCFKSRKVPQEETEIIEFAAALVEEGTFDIVDEFDKFVRPVVHPALDDFCTELTTITQEQVDDAYTFPTVLRQFKAWLEKYPGKKTFSSWGKYDREQLLRDCDKHEVEYPFDDEHCNLKRVFQEKRGYKRQCGVKTALRRLKMDFEGTPHRGIDDVRNIVKIMRKAW